MTPHSPTPGAARPQWSVWLKPAAVGLIMLVANLAAFYLIPQSVIDQLGSFGYLGVFLVTLLANATVVIPVPYYGLVARLATHLNVPTVVLLGALGSAVGESVAFFAGRSGRGAVEETRLYRWVQRQLTHPWRSFAVLFLLAAPPNPAFDVAGLTAGAMGLPFWMFFAAVFLGRIVRLVIIVLLGLQFEH